MNLYRNKKISMGNTSIDNYLIVRNKDCTTCPIVRNNLTMTMYSSTPSNKRICQPLNVYNIYFILERQRLFQEMKGSGETAADHDELPRDLAGYDFLSLPDLPPRYQELQLPHGWFVPGKNSKRKHVRSHGCELKIWMPIFVAQGSIIEII